jgi:hypothetical protein
MHAPVKIMSEHRRNTACMAQRRLCPCGVGTGSGGLNCGGHLGTPAANVGGNFVGMVERERG